MQFKFPIPTNKPNSKIKKSYHSSANKGMELEDKINRSNTFYNQNNIALIYKRPVPIRIVTIDYTKEIITKAFFEKQSTTDYNGIYKGKYVDFEAKSTINSSFPLANIKEHQLEHLKKVHYFGGLAFFIIEIDRLKETYFFPYESLIKFIQENSRKSIPFSFIQENGIKIKEGINPPLNFIDALNKYYSL